MKIAKNNSKFENYWFIFANYLKTKNLKITVQKRELLKEICEINAPFSVEELLQRLYQKQITLCRATIYNIINSLINSGLLKTENGYGIYCLKNTSMEKEPYIKVMDSKTGLEFNYRDDKIVEILKEIEQRFSTKVVAVNLKAYIYFSQKNHCT